MQRSILCSLLMIGTLSASIGTAVRRWGSQVTPSLSAEHDQTSAPIKMRSYYTLSGQPNWKQAQEFSFFRGIRYAHFELNAVDVDGEDVSVTFFLATQEQLQKGKHALKVVITQNARGSVAKVFDAIGKPVQGPIPVVAHVRETRRTPLLPWRDGMAQFYSVLLETIEGKPHMVVVQHTRNQILQEGQFYRPGTVADILKRFATHSLLANRPFGYIDDVAHMQLLPLPYMSQLYAFSLSQKLFLTWSVERGVVKVHPRNR